MLGAGRASRKQRQNVGDRHREEGGIGLFVVGACSTAVVEPVDVLDGHGSVGGGYGSVGGCLVA